jgi:hypothetical protein
MQTKKRIKKRIEININITPSNTVRINPLIYKNDKSRLKTVLKSHNLQFKEFLSQVLDSIYGSNQSK